MTATDELRAMLDERGVEWQKPKDIMSRIKTVWRDGPWEYTAIETSGGEFSVYVEHRYWLTPAQAVELGRGECHDKNGFDPELGFECTVCGAMVDTYMVTPMEIGHVRQFAYCPLCGRRVVEVGE